METYKTRPKDWASDLAFNTYVPISIDDVYGLYTYAEMLRLWEAEATAKKKDTAISGPCTLFFGNHPIRYVQVSGRVSHVEYPAASSAFKLSKFSLSDGTTDCSLECVSKDPRFTSDEPVSRNAIVCVWGNLTLFDTIQVEAHRVFVFDAERFNVYLMLRQQCMLVRMHVLEWPAEAFEYFVDALGVGSRPGNSLIGHSALIDNLEPGLHSAEKVLGLSKDWFRKDSIGWPFTK